MQHVEFTTEELSKSKIQVMEQGIDLAKFDDKDLPSDVHIINYNFDALDVFDAVRAYTMVDIFDVYCDKLRGRGFVKSIKSGYGRIKPKLYGKIKNDKK